MALARARSTTTANAPEAVTYLYDFDLNKQEVFSCLRLYVKLCHNDGCDLEMTVL